MPSFTAVAVVRRISTNTNWPPLHIQRQQRNLASDATEKTRIRQNCPTFADNVFFEILRLIWEYHLGIVLFSIKLRVITVVEKVSGHLVHF